MASFRSFEILKFFQLDQTESDSKKAKISSNSSKSSILSCSVDLPGLNDINECRTFIVLDRLDIIISFSAVLRSLTASGQQPKECDSWSVKDVDESNFKPLPKLIHGACASSQSLYSTRRMENGTFYLEIDKWEAEVLPRDELPEVRHGVVGPLPIARRKSSVLAASPESVPLAASRMSGCLNVSSQSPEIHAPIDFLEIG